MIEAISIRTIRRERVHFFVALCLFVCTTGVVSSHMYLLCFLMIIAIYRKKIVRNKQSFQIMMVIIILSTLNEFFAFIFRDDLVIHSMIEFIPYSIMIYITMYASQMVDERVFKWLVFFILIDISVAVLQKFIGVNSFFPDAVRDSSLESELLYDLTTTGLHSNTSGLGESIFLCLLLYEKFPICRFVKNYFLYLSILIGCILCFNRTTMVAIIAYFGLKAIVFEKYSYIIGCIILIVIVVFSIDGLSEIIFMQFFRGNESFDTANANLASERDMVYPFYWNYFLDHFWTGNGSFKYYVEVFKDGRQFHAHNSYLQTMANNGAIISFLYFFLIIRNIKRYNYIYILPILIFAMFQSFVLWGLSFGDFIMYKLLLDKKVKK